MEVAINPDRVDIFTQALQVYETVLQHLSSWDVMLQLLALILATVIAHQAAKATIKIPDHGSRLIIRLKENTIISFYELCFYVYILGLLGIEQSIFAGIGLGYWFITVFMIAFGIWALIRSSFVMATHSSRARYVVLILWLMVLFAFFGTGSSTFAFLRSASITFGNFTINLMLIIEAVITFTILFWVVQFLVSIIRHEIEQSKTLSPSYKVLYLKIARVGSFAIAAVIGLSVLGFDLTVLTVFTGALGLGLGIGLQRIFANFIAGIILLIDKSIKPGDLLQIDGAKGIVDHMNARYVSVVTRDGQNILVPNESMMNDKVHNLSYDDSLLQVRLNFLVVYGSDLALVRTLVEDILNKAEGVEHSHERTCLISEFTDTAVKFEIRYWIDAATAQGYMIAHNILFAIDQAFKKNKVEFYSYGTSNYATKNAEDAATPKSTPTSGLYEQE